MIASVGSCSLLSIFCKSKSKASNVSLDMVDDVVVEVNGASSNSNISSSFNSCLLVETVSERRRRLRVYDG